MNIEKAKKESKETLEWLQSMRDKAKTEEELIAAQKAIDNFFLKDPKPNKKKKEKKVRIHSEEDMYYY